jgi:uncharacterized protein YodC (DUF2158 family)
MRSASNAEPEASSMPCGPSRNRMRRDLNLTLRSRPKPQSDECSRRVFFLLRPAPPCYKSSCSGLLHELFLSIRRCCPKAHPARLLVHTKKRGPALTIAGFYSAISARWMSRDAPEMLRVVFHETSHVAGVPNDKDLTVWWTDNAHRVDDIANNPSDLPLVSFIEFDVGLGGSCCPKIFEWVPQP